MSVYLVILTMPTLFEGINFVRHGPYHLNSLSDSAYTIFKKQNKQKKNHKVIVSDLVSFVMQVVC